MSSMSLLLAIVLLHYVWFFDCSLLQQTAQRSISDIQFHAKLCNLLALFRLMYYYFAYFISYFICYSYDLTVKYWGSISPLSVCMFILVESHREMTQAAQDSASLVQVKFFRDFQFSLQFAHRFLPVGF